MAKIWEPQSFDVYESWVDAILDEASDHLTDWENTFVISIKNQIAVCRQLSQKQAEILERIYSEKTK